MRKLDKGLLLLISVLTVAITLAGCSSGFTPKGGGSISATPSGAPALIKPTNGLVQSDSGGGITIDVEWVKAEDDSLIFNVSMDTHSVDLDQYDLSELAVLHDDTDNEYHPISWDSAPGGHHRTGILTFPLPDSVNQRTAKYLEIVIRDAGGIKERILKWEL